MPQLTIKILNALAELDLWIGVYGKLSCNKSGDYCGMCKLEKLMEGVYPDTPNFCIDTFNAYYKLPAKKILRFVKGNKHG